MTKIPTPIQTHKLLTKGTVKEFRAAVEELPITAQAIAWLEEAADLEGKGQARPAFINIAKVEADQKRQILANREKGLSVVEVTTDLPAEAQSPDPRWQMVRDTMVKTRAMGRAFLFGQAWLGWQFLQLKKDYGVKEGRPSKKTPPNVAEFRPWGEVVQAETGFSARTADRYIQVFDGVKAKLGRAKKGALVNKSALAVFQTENPLAMPDDQREALMDVIASLCDGQTQATIMEELGVVAKPAAMPVNKGGAGGGTTEAPEALARHFFDGPANAIVRVRSSPEYKTFLANLPLTADEGLCLSFLRDEARAFFDEVDEAFAKAAKPAKPAKAPATTAEPVATEADDAPPQT